MLPDISGNRSKLYQNMLCIPIDQRYGEEDMDRIVNVLSGVNEYGD
jgi:dTDP-4-amino-4,6-dideoxygalactose transaminase